LFEVGVRYWDEIPDGLTSGWEKLFSPRNDIDLTDVPSQSLLEILSLALHSMFVISLVQ
jgi:hypothetical protein